MARSERLAVAAVLAGLLAAGAPAAPASAAGHGERVRSDDVVLQLSADGALVVTETIAYDFGDADRHGIERTVPVRGSWDRGHERVTALGGVRASSPTGAPHAVHLST